MNRSLLALLLALALLPGCGLLGDKSGDSANDDDSAGDDDSAENEEEEDDDEGEEREAHQ